MTRPLPVVLALVLVARPAAGQEPDTLVIAGERIARAAAVGIHGYAAFPVTLLEALGASIIDSGERIEVRMPGSVLWFRAGYGTFTVNGTMTPLHRIAFERDGVLHLPVNFFLEWLTARHRYRVEYDGRTARLGTVEGLRLAAAEAEAQRTAAAAAVPRLPHTAAARAPAAFDEPAQPPSERPEAPRTTRSARAVALEMLMRVSGSYFENFFQAPVNGEQTDLLASTAEARLSLRLADPQLLVYARASGTVFDGFAPSGAVLGGFDWSGGRHGLEAAAGYQQRNPRLHAGDQPGFADILHGTLGYAFLFPGNVQLSALGQYYDVTVAPLDTKHRSWGAGGALRYRGFGYRFSPEVGATQSQWDAPSDADGYDERMLWGSLRAIVGSLYLHARYRRALRSYATGNRNAANFGREDTRHHWTLVGDVRLTSRVSWGVYYTSETVHSTRAGRDFTTQSLTSSLSLRVW